MIPVDFSEGQSVYDDIQAEISDLDIAILGNVHIVLILIIIYYYLLFLLFSKQCWP